MPKIRENLNKQFGLIYEPPRPTDYIHGQEEVLGGTIWEKLKPEKIVNDDRVIDWKDDEPTYEYQNLGGEKNSCVASSRTNQFNYHAINLAKRDVDFNAIIERFGMKKDGKVNDSQRRTAKGSNTNPYAGNTVSAVDDYKRNYLICPEDMWPTVEMSTEEYYKEMPQEVKDYGEKLKPYFSLETKYLPTSIESNWGTFSSPDQLWEGLQLSTLWASVDGRYETDENGLIRGDELLSALKIAKGGTPDHYYNHRILIRGGVYGKKWIVHDHYLQQIREFAWDYPFGGVKIEKIIKKKLNMKKYQIKGDNSVFFLHPVLKGLGPYLDGDVYKASEGTVGYEGITVLNSLAELLAIAPFLPWGIGKQAWDIQAFKNKFN